MTDFEFKEEDIEGQKTLDVFSEADKYNNWIFDYIRPFCKGRIIELGSGIGNISQILLNENFSVVLSDLRENYCRILHHKFGHLKNPPEIVQLDLGHPDFLNMYSGLLQSFDSIVILNVLEHIKDDNKAIQSCYQLLKADGHLIVFVPALQSLYNRFDKGLEHYRRYSKKNLSQLIRKNKFEVIFGRYINVAGIFGWFVSGAILRNRMVPNGQVKLYNKLVPVFKLMDKVMFHSLGLGVICVGKKRQL